MIYVKPIGLSNGMDGSCASKQHIKNESCVSGLLSRIDRQLANPGNKIILAVDITKSNVTFFSLNYF